MLSEYAYEDLREAVKKNPTQENINALGGVVLYVWQQLLER